MSNPQFLNHANIRFRLKLTRIEANSLHLSSRKSSKSSSSILSLESLRDFKSGKSREEEELVFLIGK